MWMAQRDGNRVILVTGMSPSSDHKGHVLATTDLYGRSSMSTLLLLDSVDTLLGMHGQYSSAEDSDMFTETESEGPRSRRVAHNRATGINTSYFAAGGALDSQTSETQFISGLFGESHGQSVANATLPRLAKSTTAVKEEMPVIMGRVLSQGTSNNVPRDVQYPMDKRRNADMEPPQDHGVDCNRQICFAELKRVIVHLQHQLHDAERLGYEYLGRWTAASARICELQDNAAGNRCGPSIANTHNASNGGDMIGQAFSDFGTSLDTRSVSGKRRRT